MVLLSGQHYPDVVFHQHKGRNRGQNRPHRNQACVVVDSNGFWLPHKQTLSQRSYLKTEISLTPD
jgi:hypothetical protein